jgi:hypothetical protein
MQIAAADSGRTHSDENFPEARFGLWEIFDNGLSIP